MTISLAPRADRSFHAVQRRLAGTLPAGAGSGSTVALDLGTPGTPDPPRLIPASVIEGKTLRSHEIGRPPVARFRAFLDGTQASRLVAHVDGVPIVHGTTAAVVRERVERRMRTWRTPLIERRLYAPVALIPDGIRSAIAGAGIDIVDTLESSGPDSLHPFALQDAAIHAVQRDRETLERQLAEYWCEASKEELLIDGPISGAEGVAASACAIGVVKSHRTLYAEGSALRTVLSLGPAQRSSVFRITSPKRTPVASWYLRMRDASGRDPLWGLVRVEVADSSDRGAIARRADEVSEWVLAEALPVATPDSRWDKMVYGVRDCEEFLRAIQ